MRALVVLLLSTTTLGAQSLEQRLQSRLDSLQRAGAFVGASVAVVLPDGKRIAVASGWSDSAQRSPLTPSLRMLAGSTGKTFFAALAYQLARDGRLPLDAPISRWLGSELWFDSLPNARQITVRQLMNHTSGLVRYELNPRFLADLTAQPDRVFAPVEELRYLFGSQAAFAAGQGWDYSDTNYIVLAMIMERITATRAYDEIVRRFLQPLRLTGTIASDRRDLPELAQGYAGVGNPFGARRSVGSQRLLSRLLVGDAVVPGSSGRDRCNGQPESTGARTSGPHSRRDDRRHGAALGWPRRRRNAVERLPR